MPHMVEMAFELSEESRIRSMGYSYGAHGPIFGELAPPFRSTVPAHLSGTLQL